MSIPIGSMSDTGKPWEKWSSETDLAYNYFVSYLEMGAVRSLPKVCQKYTKKDSYVTQLKKWSSKFKWVERCAAYDRHIIKKSLQKKEEVLDHANARLLNMVDYSIDQLEEILKIDMYEPILQENELGTTQKINPQLLAQKLKAIDLVLKKAGVVDKTEEHLPVANDATFNQYIQNIYNLIDEKKI